MREDSSDPPINVTVDLKIKRRLAKRRSSTRVLRPTYREAELRSYLNNDILLTVSTTDSTARFSSLLGLKVTKLDQIWHFIAIGPYSTTKL